MFNYYDELKPDIFDVLEEEEEKKIMEGKKMFNYYDELKLSIFDALEEEENKEIINQAKNKSDAYDKLYDKFVIDDSITGNASGSYYCSSWRARHQCYNYSYEVIEALEEYGYKKELELFKMFEELVDVNYINIDTIEINYDVFFEEEEENTYRWYFEKIENLDFEKLDVITRCYFLGIVLRDALDNYLD